MTRSGYDILSLQKSQDFEGVNIRNISMLLKVHSFRKTEIKPILFFEPIDNQRPGVFHQSRTGCCQKTRDFWAAPSHSGLVWWNVATNTCTDSQTHVYSWTQTRGRTLTVSPIMTNPQQMFILCGKRRGNYSSIPGGRGISCTRTVDSSAQQMFFVVSFQYAMIIFPIASNWWRTPFVHVIF